MKALVALCLLTGVAHADDDDDNPNRRTHTQLFGFHIGGGRLPIHDTDLRATGLGLTVEHRVKGDLRLAGTYEYLFLGVEDPDDQDKMVTSGSGHRAELALHYPFAATKILLRNLRLFIDAELGVALLVGSTTQTGTLVDAQGFAGLRFGYDLIKLRHDTKASPVWEPAVFIRAVATDTDSIGYMAGIGMYWGD